MPKHKNTHFDDELAYEGTKKSNALEKKFDKQLEELQRMNQEINQLKTQQRKEKTNFQLFKVRQQKKISAIPISKSRASKPRLDSDSSKSSHEQKMRIDLPEEGLKHTDSKLDVIQQLLREKCTQGQLINPSMALQLLNIAQREEDPEAYEPEFVVQQRKKLEQQKQEA